MKPLLTIRATITRKSGRSEAWGIDVRQENKTPDEIAREIDDAFLKIRETVAEQLEKGRRT